MRLVPTKGKVKGAQLLPFHRMIVKIVRFKEYFPTKAHSIY